MWRFCLYHCMVSCMTDFYYIAVPYNNLCIAGKYKTKEDAEKDLLIFNRGSGKIFPSESPDIGDKIVLNRARELLYSPTK